MVDPLSNNCSKINDMVRHVHVCISNFTTEAEKFQAYTVCVATGSRTFSKRVMMRHDADSELFS